MRIAIVPSGRDQYKVSDIKNDQTIDVEAYKKTSLAGRIMHIKAKIWGQKYNVINIPDQYNDRKEYVVIRTNDNRCTSLEKRIFPLTNKEICEEFKKKWHSDNLNNMLEFIEENFLEQTYDKKKHSYKYTDRLKKNVSIELLNQMTLYALTQQESMSSQEDCPIPDGTIQESLLIVMLLFIQNSAQAKQELKVEGDEFVVLKEKYAQIKVLTPEGFKKVDTSTKMTSLETRVDYQFAIQLLNYSQDKMTHRLLTGAFNALCIRQGGDLSQEVHEKEEGKELRVGNWGASIEDIQKEIQEDEDLIEDAKTIIEECEKNLTKNPSKHQKEKYVYTTSVYRKLLDVYEPRLEENRKILAYMQAQAKEASPLEL